MRECVGLRTADEDASPEADSRCGNRYAVLREAWAP